MARRPWLARYPPSVSPIVGTPNLALGGILADVSRRFGSSPALEFAGYGLTWREVHELASRFAGNLHALGIRKGDRVMLVLPNTPHFVIAYYGVLLLGAIAVPANPLYTAHELEAHARRVSARALVVLDLHHDKAAPAGQAAGVRYLVVGTVTDFMPRRVRAAARLAQRINSHPADGERSRTSRVNPFARIPGAMLGRLPAFRRLRALPQTAPIAYSESVLSFRSLLTRLPAAWQPAEVTLADDAVLLHTGGTTGTPKVVALTHGNLVSNAAQMKAWFPVLGEGTATILAVVPFFHAFGLTLALNAGLFIAARLVLVPRLVLADIFKAIDDYRPSVFPGVPPLFAALVESAQSDRSNLGSIQVCVSGGAALPPDIRRRFEALTGAPLYQGYGLTEASPATHCTPNDGSGPHGSIGLPLPATEARILDSAGRPVPPGERGELWVRGPQVMRGYWEDPEETAAVIRDGWLRTGDIASMDEQGFFQIVDREKDVINVAGEKVYPSEVEEALRQHPAVADAGVVGVPHRLRGESVAAFVVLQEGATATREELTAWLRERIAGYKVPREIQFLPDLPKTPLGKVLRRELRPDRLPRPPRLRTGRRENRTVTR